MTDPDGRADSDLRGVAGLVAVMHRLRRECPWDAQQTHASLVPFLVEETGELVEAIEAGDDAHLREELGDLLLQVVFHAEIAAGFGIDEVADGIAAKLIRRHPYVYGDADVPGDLLGSWEERKAAEKGRTSVLEGVPEQLSALTRASRIIGRARSRAVRLDLPADPVEADSLGRDLLALAARAVASGIDPEQALRAAVRELEAAVVAAESAP